MTTTTTALPTEVRQAVPSSLARLDKLVSVGGDIDLATEQGRMMARMKGTVARYEIEQSRRRLKAKNKVRGARWPRTPRRSGAGSRRVPTSSLRARMSAPWSVCFACAAALAPPCGLAEEPETDGA